MNEVCSEVRRYALLTSLFSLGLLAGCGGSGPTSTLGGGQDPDPVVQDFRVAYVKRPLLVDDDGDRVTFDVRDPSTFSPGAELFIRDRASVSSVEKSITEGVFPNDDEDNPPLYDVKDLTASADGTLLAFAMRAPDIPGADEDEQPTWNIWIYEMETATLRRVISSDIIAEDGHDIAPRFLPDDRLIFASTRQRQAKAILLDEGKPQFANQDEDRDNDAFVLHVMSDDGTDIRQVTFNQSNDLDPAVLDDGRVVFSRWDNAGNVDRISLYVMNPDGTEMHVLYGVHSHDTGPNGEDVEFMEAQELPDGRLLVMQRTAAEQSHFGGFPVAIDVLNYVEHDEPTAPSAGLIADAQEALVGGEIMIDAVPSPRGRLASVFPLYDGTARLLVTWSQCRLLDPLSEDPLDPQIIPCTEELLADPAVVEADPLYGIWVFDPVEGTQQPILVPDEGEAYTDAVVFEPRTLPAVILDKTAGIDLDADLVSENVGVLHIRSVYDLDGTAIADIETLRDPDLTLADARPFRFVRVVKAVSIPDDDIVDLDNTAFGRSNGQLMREVIGYAPVEPDGSVKMRVPANIPFAVSVLDANGRRLTPRHQNWLQLRPGEEMECVGCHAPLSQLPHGRIDAQPPSINAGAPVDGSPFPNTEPALFANAGETMAEVYTRINGIPEPNVDIVYDDVWTDPAVRAKDPSFDFSYQDLQSTPPLPPNCVQDWNASCRIVVNYEMHIHPIWSVPRITFEADGVTVAQDDTCNTCHSPLDAAGMAQVPADQLDLADGASPDEADHFNSYRELLFPDNRQVVVGDVLVDELVPAFDDNGNPIFILDADGNPILDANGDPIPLLVPVEFGPPMSVAGALASPRFFDRFAPGGTHEGRLSPAELKLISEWIDVGGQYYNNPFDVPP